MEDSRESSGFALRLVFVLSLILVTMDIFEIYFGYATLKELSVKFKPLVFEECVKYHILSQMLFTFFATSAGISALLMSLGLLVDYDFFSYKVADTFLYYNYMIFGPYLFAACVLGFNNFGAIVYNCESLEQTHMKTFNFSTLLALMFCSILSFLLTFGFAIFYGVRKIMLSVRYDPDGIYLIGRIFWKFLFNRTMDSIRINEQEMREVNIRNNNHQRGVIIRDNLRNENIINNDIL